MKNESKILAILIAIALNIGNSSALGAENRPDGCQDDECGLSFMPAGTVFHLKRDFEFNWVHDAYRANVIGKCLEPEEGGFLTPVLLKTFPSAMKSAGVRVDLSY